VSHVAIDTLRDRADQIKVAIEAACAAVDRSPDSVTVVAVSKMVDRASMQAAYNLGFRHFGENRVQDARVKLGEPMPDDCVLHLIGQLQTNKTSHAVDLFNVIESVDRPSLIAELEKQAARRAIKLPILLQVNVAGEAQKAGCEPEAAGELATAIAWSEHLSFQGLMTMAPLVDDPEDVRAVFRNLRELRDQLQDGTGIALPTLSMGMTNDFEIAIEEGATHVRIGRAIFG
jgi:PLP dependent protein